MVSMCPLMDVAGHLLQRMKLQKNDQNHETNHENCSEEDTVYMIPRGSKPASEYSNPNLLLGIFPTLFPYGCGALEDPSRPVKLDFREHLRYLLSIADRRFEEHHSFIFVVFNILQRRTAYFHARLMTSTVQSPFTLLASIWTLTKFCQNDWAQVMTVQKS